MQLSQNQIIQVLNARSLGADGTRKKEPPTYESKLNEDLELWIFMTVEYYSNKQHIMQANSSEFMAFNFEQSGKSFQNWQRTLFATECAKLGVHKAWQRFIKVAWAF